MKIIKITPGEYEEIETDEMKWLSKYRRLGEMQWEHWLGDTHQWLAIRFCDQLEDMYQDYMKEQNGQAKAATK